MTALQPLDRHPADPGTLTADSSSLAAQASMALTLDSSTQRAYTPVHTNWHGIGSGEAQQTIQLVSAEARQVSSAPATAAVALAAWARSVEQFNDEVDQIVRRLANQESAATSASSNQTIIDSIRAEARRQAERDWHTAYDTYIVAGRAQVQQIITQGPGDDLVLQLFQAGLLPMSVVNVFPNVDFGRADWRALFANLRAHGIDPLEWAAAGTYDPALLRERLDLFRGMGVPPREFSTLLQVYYVSVAADKAGIDLTQWDPNRGASALSDIIQRVYTYYGNLYLDHPWMQWAGMANMVGPSFAAGFYDLSLFRRVAGWLDKPGVPFDMSVIAHASDQELKFFETTFLSMQKDIFYDQASMHEAYLEGGMGAIRELEAAGLIDSRTSLAWDQIDEGRLTGDADLLAAGNTALLRREQEDVIQYNYDRMYDRPVTGPAFTYLMTAIGEPSIPGAHSFSDYKPLVVTIDTPGPDNIPFTPWDNPLEGEVNVTTPLPDGNIAHFDDRWTYITEDTLPAYQELIREHPDQAREIIGTDVGDRIDDYRIYHRLDSLAEQYLTDWGVDFDQ